MNEIKSLRALRERHVNFTSLLESGKNKLLPCLPALPFLRNSHVAIVATNIIVTMQSFKIHDNEFPCLTYYYIPLSGTQLTYNRHTSSILNLNSNLISLYRTKGSK